LLATLRPVPMQYKSPLLQALQSNLRLQHLSRRTEAAYVYWTRRFVPFSGLRHPSELGDAEVRQFLTHLVVERNLSAATQQQALSALLFLYRNVIGRPLEALGRLPRGRVPTTLPVVLTADEVAQVLGALRGIYRLVGLVLYGGGLRLTECLQLRVKDLDLSRGELTVRRGKGQRIVTRYSLRRPTVRLGSSYSKSRRCMSVIGREGQRGSRYLQVSRPSIPRRVAPGRGNGCSRLGALIGTGRLAGSTGTTSMSLRSSGRWRRRSGPVGSASGPVVPASLLCDPPAGGGIRHPNGSGAAGPP
jgi:integrase